MKRKVLKITIVMMMAAVISAGAQAAFIVEAHDSGLANANFSGPARYSGTPSTAVGLLGSMSAYGGTSDPPDTYVYSYTPGTDADNVAFSAGIDLGNGNLYSGLPGGGSGLYNVYITWPASTNANAGGSTITITNDGDDVVLPNVNQNNGMSGDPGGNDAWLLIAEAISLTAGNTYSVSQAANVDSWVSQRSHGVMWEAVPEPATMLLLGAGALFLRRKR